jgi:TRAP-type mannitol/chloroaromatic compound transport system substrate-binding protein
MINRRKLLGAATIGAAGLAATACSGDTSPSDETGAPAVIRRKTRLTMTTTWPKDLPGLGMAANRVAERIEALSGGQMEVSVYAAGELVPAFEAFDAVASGNVDMYHGADYYWQSKSKAFNFFTSVPMGMTSTEIMGWIDFGGGQALWEELSGQYGVIAFQATNTGHQMGGWFKKEINSLDDFRGLKMRIPGLGGDVVRALGGAAEALPGNEVFQALQTGRIDATEWVGPWNDYFLGFHREADYYYGPGFHEPGSVLALGLNRSKWNSLTPTEQQIIRSAAREVNHLSVGEFQYQNGIYLDKLVREEGVQLRQFPNDVVSRVVEISADIRADAGSGGDLERRIYESFEDALRKSRSWASISDGPYLSARER